MAKQQPRVSKISLGRCLSSSLLRLRRRAAKKPNRSRLRLSQHPHKKAATLPPIDIAPDSPRYEVGEYPNDSPCYEVGKYDDVPISPHYEVGEYMPDSPYYTPDSPCYTPDSPCYTPDYTPDSPCYTPDSPRYEVGEYEDVPDSPLYEVGEYSDAQVGDYEEEEDPYKGPILDSVWRGCLQIRGASFGSLSALVSRKACPKAVKAATALPPEVLSATITPRLECWPNEFSSGPTDNNIGIYLLPADDCCTEGYDMLVNDVMRRDVAMRVSYAEYDLLIFGSDQLPPRFSRISERYYLWGVFSART